jgi:outer membrane receptor protein involved in Fe transport
VLNLEYDLTRALTLTSVTGYSWVHTVDATHGAFGLNTAYDVAGEWAESDVSEEVRLASGWKDSWFNFVVGALYAPGYNSNTEYANIPGFTVWGTEYLIQKSDYDSAFAQFILTPIANWEIAPGVRYTHVKKYFDNLQVFNNDGIPGNVGVNQAPLVPTDLKSISEDNTSPEVTVTYHASPDWTFYGSYKQGYKGPGFNAQSFLLASFNPAIANGGETVNAFGGEKVAGGEFGAKATLLDRHLNLTLTPYFYKFSKLQVSNLNYLTHVIEVTNGADAKTYGVEFSANYKPPVEGLQINTSVAYNEAQFTSFPLSPCWGGQTLAQGCVTNADGSQTQNLAGRTLYQAPRFAGYVGGTYDRTVGDYIVGLSVNGTFSSGYYTTAQLLPSGFQPDWVTMDASVHLGKSDRSWDLALIGRNLTDRLYVVGASDAGLVTPGVMADAFGFTNRTRQVMLQITARPNKIF